MKSKTIKVDKMADELMAELNAISGFCFTATAQAIDKTAEETVNQLHATSPSRTGKYAASWTYGPKKNSRPKYSDVVYSEAPEYRLTHLLENGHIGRDGKRVKAYPHIADAYRDAKDNLVKNLKQEIEKQIKENT